MKGKAMTNPFRVVAAKVAWWVAWLMTSGDVGVRNQAADAAAARWLPKSTEARR